MVFGWLFGERKKQEAGSADVGALLAQADEATNAKDAEKAESLCREILRHAPDNADAWNMLGVNLIRKRAADPDARADAVVAWMRVLTLRPGDARAADHLRVEIQYPDDLVGGLASKLGDPAPYGEDAAGALAQIGSRARAALENAAKSGGLAAERAKGVLGSMG